MLAKSFLNARFPTRGDARATTDILVLGNSFASKYDNNVLVTEPIECPVK